MVVSQVISFICSICPELLLTQRIYTDGGAAVVQNLVVMLSTQRKHFHFQILHAESEICC
jgi:hypothetical protein